MLLPSTTSYATDNDVPHLPVLGITKCDGVREATYLKVTFIKGEKISGLGAQQI